MIAARLTISGRVQGVHFRDSMIEAARAAGVTGWVRNRRDGDVEAFVQGPPEAVDRVIAWARHGPPLARVERVDVDDEPSDPALRAFDRRPTA